MKEIALKLRDLLLAGTALRRIGYPATASRAGTDTAAFCIAGKWKEANILV